MADDRWQALQATAQGMAGARALLELDLAALEAGSGSDDDDGVALEAAEEAMADAEAWADDVLELLTRARSAAGWVHVNPEHVARPSAAPMLCKVADLAAHQLARFLAGEQADLTFTLDLLQGAVADAILTRAEADAKWQAFEDAHPGTLVQVKVADLQPHPELARDSTADPPTDDDGGRLVSLEAWLGARGRQMPGTGP